jgi:hypothetical protein
VSVNKFQPHVFVLPEDDANRQLANGFVLELGRQIQVLPVAGGWNEVLSRFKSDHTVGMERYSDRYMVLLIDFDGRPNRLAVVKDVIPQNLADRVFVLGTLEQPEALTRAGLGSYETIGSALSRECREGTATIWSHSLLQHNAGEVERLSERVRPILFPPL